MRREIQQGPNANMLCENVRNLLSTTLVWSLLAACLIVQNALYAMSTGTQQRDNTAAQLAPAHPFYIRDDNDHALQ
jgi:hypothetical protein